jgi:hypothetical protein
VEALWSCLLLRLRRPYVNGGEGCTKIQCMLQAYISNISDVLDACCKCFIRMLQKWINVLQWAIYICMFQVFHLIQAYIASVSFGCCKTRSRCCIYMQVFQVFLYVCCNYFILMFAYVCNGYTCVFKFFLFCKYFRRMLQVFHLFRMYVASVSSECYKSRSGVTHVAIHVRRGERSLCAVWWCGPYVAARNASSRRGVLAQARETKCRTFRG